MVFDVMALALTAGMREYDTTFPGSEGPLLIVEFTEYKYNNYCDVYLRVTSSSVHFFSSSRA